MGGTALNKIGIETVRLSRGEYNQLVQDVTKQLSSKLFLSANVVPSYRTKDSFGDLDILVPIDQNEVKRDLDDFINDLIPIFTDTIDTKGFVRNGNIISFEYKDFQVDLIFCDITEYSFSYNYFSWNDLGNFIGRTAHRLGFKFGHDGLWYILRDQENEDRVVSEILVTRYFHQALEFLGYDIDKFNSGFDTPQQIFEYASSSKYFDPASFLLNNRSYAARVRDKKRKMYSGMLSYIVSENPQLSEDSEPIPVNKKEHLDRALSYFSKFKSRYETIAEQYAIDREFKKRFNGEIIGSLFGLEDKQLGVCMKKIRQIVDKFNLKPFVNAMNEREAKELFIIIDGMDE